jgi:hypothetical protein
MARNIRIGAAFAAVLWLLLAPAVQADPVREDDAAGAATSSAGTDDVSAAPPGYYPPIQYVPPQRGRPVRTEGGATRGRGAPLPSLYVLVPEHAGQTVSEQPSLFWYIDGPLPPSAQIEFVLTDDEAIEPLVQATLPAPAHAGVKRIRLSDHGFRLKKGTEYQWSISIAPDPANPSHDIVASGRITRVDPPADLDERLHDEGASHTPHIYASAGLWYDAFTALSDQIDTAPAPEQGPLVEARGKLLEQVGLEVHEER